MDQSLVKRHLAKTMTWRIVGTIDTMIIGWLVSGNLLIGLGIGGTEVITKMILYFVHERLWFKLLPKVSKGELGFVYRYRHTLKTITWRIIGTLDTMLLAWLISGDPLMGFQIGSIEVVTKVILYYLHERIWYKLPFGIETQGNEE